MTENLLDQDNDNLELDPNANYLEALVGDNKKFKTPEDLAKGKAQSDHYIKTLERRLDAISDDYKKVLDERNAMPKLQDLIEKFDKLDMQNLQSRDNTQNSNEDPNRQALNPEQLESLVTSKYAQLKQNERENDNYMQVRNKLSETLGNNFKAVLKEKSDALGLTDDEVNQMARKNPNLFFKTFDLNTIRQDNFQSPPTNVMRNNSLSNRQEKRTMAYYEKMRKDNPKLYLDPKIAVQMDKDAQELGEAFFDTNV